MPDSGRRNSLLITDSRTGENFNILVDNTSLSDMDVKNVDKPDNDIVLPTVDKQQVIQELDRFSGALAGELIAKGRVVVDGLGTFSVIHEHAKRESTGAGSRFLPPRNRVTFEPRPASGGDTARLAVERLDMTTAQAAQLSHALTGMFQSSRKQSLEINLRGFGSFSMVDGLYGFQPEPSLEELLNSAYDGLKTIDIQERPADAPIQVPVKTGGGGAFNKVAAVLVAGVLLGGGGYFVVRQVSLDNMVASSGRKALSPSHEDAKVSAPPLPVKSGAPASQDSVTLVKGRFTVVASTFTSLKTVHQEMQRLSELGHRVMVWPVADKGRHYYRLVIGDFETHLSALDSLKTMPKGLTKNIYIQQAPKNVVLYGEKGL
ncbi:MAG: HU family DNA-binding protein [Chlorobiaceae bacterium]|nr:HU family DNA-binding protein [Chlorobiaceae bacterium]